MLVLGIETACDDSAAAVVQDGEHILSNVVWTQRRIHEAYGGVVPELAARRHALVITSVMDQALTAASVSLESIDAVAVNNQHGLLRSVIVGVAAAQGVAIVTGKPLVGIHHIEGHIYSGILSEGDLSFPHICLAVAGGHNLLILVRAIGDYEIIGRSLDDAAGEAFDKVAKELGLGFPGGALVNKLATSGDPQRYALPRPMLNRRGYDFSFSGLKTAVRDLIKSLGTELEGNQAHVAASFQRAVVDVLTHQTLKASRDFGIRAVSVVGGVASNSELRTRLAADAAPLGIQVAFARPELCTDNAAMIAGLAFHKLQRPGNSSFVLDAFPNAPLGIRGSTYKA